MLVGTRTVQLCVYWHQRFPTLLTPECLTVLKPELADSGYWHQTCKIILTPEPSKTVYWHQSVQFCWDQNCSTVGLFTQDLPTGADSCMTSLSLDHTSNHLIVGGCGDGTVRVFDKRLPPNEWFVALHLSILAHQNYVESLFKSTN